MRVDDTGFRLLAGRCLRKHIEVLARQLNGARKADDSEYVHQARVASRRLRAALPVFGECLPPKKVKKWRKEIRRLTNRLGHTRDKDVQITFLRSVKSSLPDDKKKRCAPGLNRVLLRIEQQRNRLQPIVVRTVDQFEASGVLGEIHACTAAASLGLMQYEGDIRTPYVFERAFQHIQHRLTDVLRFEDSLERPDDYERHHKMRIAAKRLRYTLEMCAPAYDGKLDRAIKTVKKLQTQLGDLHDLDVWIDHLDRFLVDEEQRTRDYFGHTRPFARLRPGILYLREDCRRRRETCFADVALHWRKLRDEGLWNKLIRTVREPMLPAAEEARAETPSDEPSGEPESDP